MNEILSGFDLGADPVSASPYGTGIINRTFLVTCADGKRYILQRISEQLTRQPELLMENIVRVTGHLRRKEPDPRRVLTVRPARTGRPLYTDASGSWRIYGFIEDTVCYSKLRSDEDFYRTALAFGHFEQQLDGHLVGRLILELRAQQLL